MSAKAQGFVIGVAVGFVIAKVVNDARSRVA
jgi:uncharacterized membrane-anchored protein YhcB (DUF1043 family)